MHAPQPRHALLAIVAAALLTAALPAFASQADLDREVDQLIADFDARAQPIDEIVKRIKWNGISDTRLFDKIEASLLATYETAKDHDGEQYNSWLVQALAFSGQDKYRATLERVLLGKITPKLHRHTMSSMEVLPDFQRWNPVISNGVADVPADQIRRKRTLNMLQGEDPELARAGAAVAYHEFTRDDGVLDVIAAQLTARLPAAASDPEAAEACAWFAKVLGESGQQRFVPVLTEAGKRTTAPAVRRYTEKALNQLKSQNR